MKKLARGKSLEKEINKTNLFYRKNELALIMKNPTPMSVTSSGIIPSAGLPDYSGCTNNGRYIVIEAKECKGKSLPLSNIAEHQIMYMNIANKLNAFTYFIIRFTDVGDCFLVPSEIVNEYWEKAKIGGRKSIPIDEVQQYIVDIEDYLSLKTE